MGAVEFDSEEGRWKDEKGEHIKVKGTVSDEDLLKAYLLCYRQALADGKDGTPDFTTHNAAKLIKDLRHRVSLGGMRNRIALARRRWNKRYGQGPYKYRMVKDSDGNKVQTYTHFPTLKVRQIVSEGEEERNAWMDKLHAELFD